MAEKNQIVLKLGSFPTLLGLAFIILRLCNVITWSWWWVLAPFWAPIVFVIILLLAVIICYIIYGGR